MEKWEEHRIITGKPNEPLPKGLKGSMEGGCFIVKVPEYPHPLHDKYMEWCRKTSITNGFSL